MALDTMERPALLRPGEMFEGFRLVRLLGRGGVGDVFEIAFRGTRMALKVVRVPQGCDEGQLQKLLREGRIQGWIKHPNGVEVFETGVTRNGLAWIRMELLRGLTLRDVLHIKGTLSIALTVHYLRQMGIALQQCHRLGAVHRETKPENLFVLPDHRIKLHDHRALVGVERLTNSNEGTKENPVATLADAVMEGGSSIAVLADGATAPADAAGSLVKAAAQEERASRS